MAKVCAVCGKGQVSGNNVSHAMNHNKRVWKPNLKRVKIDEQGTTKRIYVCSRCLRSGKVQRAV
jgi:large subunit ribosomal protein L28